MPRSNSGAQISPSAKELTAGSPSPYDNLGKWFSLTMPLLAAASTDFGDQTRGALPPLVVATIIQLRQHPTSQRSRSRAWQYEGTKGQRRLVETICMSQP